MSRDRTGSGRHSAGVGVFDLLGTDSPFQVLGVSLDASKTEIRKAFLKAAKRSHPDAIAASSHTPSAGTASLDSTPAPGQGSGAPTFNPRRETGEPSDFLKLRAAYDILSDATLRAEWLRSPSGRAASAAALYNPGELRRRAAKFDKTFKVASGSSPHAHAQGQWTSDAMRRAAEPTVGEASWHWMLRNPPWSGPVPRERWLRAVAQPRMVYMAPVFAAATYYLMQSDGSPSPYAMDGRTEKPGPRQKPAVRRSVPDGSAGSRLS